MVLLLGSCGGQRTFGGVSSLSGDAAAGVSLAASVVTQEAISVFPFRVSSFACMKIPSWASLCFEPLHASNYYFFSLRLF